MGERKGEQNAMTPTIKMPAMLLLGALAPMPPLMSTGPPGMLCDRHSEDGIETGRKGG